MMSAISTKSIAKVFRRYPSHWSRILEWIGIDSKKSQHANFWALKDINFEIAPGTSTAFLGINGTGKSTLLKILTGIVQATEGQYRIGGNLTALIELGIGFHPEFTGRENLFLTGQLLGLSSQEITELLPAIHAFSEIGEYLDLPLKSYSSGMQARLAFSLAAARRPDIFIVDEALSVGDAYFQQKSFNRIKEFRDLGTTVLLVSHDKETILSFCNSVILMDQGQIVAQGSPQAMVDLYMAMLADPERKNVSQTQNKGGQTQTISGTGEARVASIELYPNNKEFGQLPQVFIGQQVRLELRIKINSNIEKLVVGIAIKNAVGQVMYGTNTFLSNQVKYDLRSQEELLYQFSFPMNLGAGTYSISSSLAGAQSHIEKNYEWKDLAYQFEVIDPTYPESAPYHGNAYLMPQIATSHIKTSQ
jgi:lipopolysaccharide transport system ATP-binding protein